MQRKPYFPTTIRLSLESVSKQANKENAVSLCEIPPLFYIIVQSHIVCSFLRHHGCHKATTK